MLTEMHCPECLEVQLFEQPPCTDGHGADCPDWVCTVCGAAVSAGVSWSPVATSERGGSSQLHAA